jgi:hypothetical protein
MSRRYYFCVSWKLRHRKKARWVSWRGVGGAGDLVLNVMVGGTSTNTGCAISWPVLCQVSTSTCLRQERHLSRNNFTAYARYCRIALVGSECYTRKLFKSGYASFPRPAYRQLFACLLSWMSPLSPQWVFRSLYTQLRLQRLPECCGTS